MTCIGKRNKKSARERGAGAQEASGAQTEANMPECTMRHLNILDMLRDIGKDHDERQGFMAMHWLTSHASDAVREQYNEFVREANRERRAPATDLLTYEPAFFETLTEKKVG